MKSYRSNLIFVTVDLLFHELLPFIENFVLFAMLLDIRVKVGSKFLYEDLQIKFDFCHG